MTLDRLWAGWRADYVGGTGEPVDTPSSVTANGAPRAASDCVFCWLLASDESGEEGHIVWGDDSVAVILNAYPYSSGHMLVMPRRHARELEDLTRDEAQRLWSAVHTAVATAKAAYRPDGMNLGVNLGRAAGAGIPAHLHVHVVPRWAGDTNFMTATAEVRVLPEALPASLKRLKEAWPR